MTADRELGAARPSALPVGGQAGTTTHPWTGGRARKETVTWSCSRVTSWTQPLKDKVDQFLKIIGGFMQ